MTDDPDRISGTVEDGAEFDRTVSLKVESGGRPRISSADLFAGGRTEICIEHEGAEYRLRITRQKKLILCR